jgi:hypothetical protein
VPIAITGHRLQKIWLCHCMVHLLKIKTKQNRLSNHLAPVQAMKMPYINFQVSEEPLEFQYETDYHSLHCCLWNILAYCAMCYEEADIFQLCTFNSICKIPAPQTESTVYFYWKTLLMKWKSGRRLVQFMGPGYVTYVCIFLGSIIICWL